MTTMMSEQIVQDFIDDPIELLIKEARQLQKRRHRLITAAVVACLFLAAGVAYFVAPSENFNPPTKSGTAPTAALAASCTVNHLTIAPGNRFGTGDGGTDIYPLVFTNTGSTFCSLLGSPRVSFIDSRGLQIAGAAIPITTSYAMVSVSRNATSPRHTLAPGHSVTDIVLYNAGMGSSCTNALVVSGLRIHLSGQNSPLVVRTHTFMCSQAPQNSLLVYRFGVGHLI